MPDHHYKAIPKSRIATFDVYEVGKTKHHISALLECDVTDSRLKLKQKKSEGKKWSFNAWLLKVIGNTIQNYPEVAAYMASKKKLIIFDDINITMVVEKELNGEKVPIPLTIDQVNTKSVEAITMEIEVAKKQNFSTEDIVLHQKSNKGERFYYLLPKFLRLFIWKYVLGHPKVAYRKMGNVVVTSVGMMGRINGWFIHSSVHPISFGIGSIMKKPWVVDDEICIREILNMTILLDHDVIDGAPMARFVQELVKNIEKGVEL
ncbi:MAG TPA: dehydrogenase [Cytophagales bacterium]|jgi:pyruvate/2-oxoglutarate dehydrogenase complex dihydrolipoamide acyltransferase (E2) component|nr:dehydrogenase [Cytophagales bacterium]